MALHHSKHHQTYVTNLNVFEEKLDAAISKKDITSQIALQGALKFNGGGHINRKPHEKQSAITHKTLDLDSIFWTNLTSPKSGGGELSKGTHI